MGLRENLQAKLAEGKQDDLGSLFSEFAGQENALFLVLFCGGDGMDLLTLTPLRLFQVFSNIWANNGNNDAINPDSLFSQWFPERELSNVAAVCLVGIVASFGVGIAKGLYQRRHKKYKQTFDYMAQQLKAVNPRLIEQAQKQFSAEEDKQVLLTFVLKQLIQKSKDDHNELLTLKYQCWLDDKTNLLAREASILAEVGAQAEYEKALILRKCIAILAVRTSKQKKSDYLQDLENYQNKMALEKKANRYKLSGFLSFINGNTSLVTKKIFGEKYGPKVDAALGYVSDAFSYIWNKLSIAGFFFWLTFMTFVIATSFGAAIASPLVVPLIVGISIGLAVTFNVWEIVEKIRAKKAGIKQPTPKEQAEVQESARRAHNAKLHVFMKVESEGMDETIKAQMKAMKALPKEKITAAKPEEKIDIRKRLLGSRFSRGARIFTTGLRGIIDGIMFFSFTGWFLSTVVGLLPALAGVAAFLGSAATSGITGFVAGIFLNFRAGAKLRAEQLAYKEKVDALLAAPYLGKDGAGKTMQEAFENLYALLEAKRARLLELYSHKELKERFQYDLGKVNVFNDRTKHKTSVGTIFRKILNRAAAIFGGMQTGLFHARYFFLRGALFAGAANMIAIGSFALGAAFWPFMIVAGVFALGFGALKVIEYQQQRDQARRENFYNTFVEDISYLKREIKKMTALISLAEKQASSVALSTESPSPEQNGLGQIVPLKKSNDADTDTEYSSSSVGSYSGTLYGGSSSPHQDAEVQISHSRPLPRRGQSSASH